MTAVSSLAVRACLAVSVFTWNLCTWPLGSPWLAGLMLSVYYCVVEGQPCLLALVLLRVPAWSPE